MEQFYGWDSFRAEAGFEYSQSTLFLLLHSLRDGIEALFLIGWNFR